MQAEIKGLNRFGTLVAAAMPLVLAACVAPGPKLGPDGQPVLSPEERRLQSVEDSVATLMRRVEASESAGASQEMLKLLDEVRALRGDVENLRHDVDRSSASQKQLFANFDSRLLVLESGGAAAATSGAASAAPQTTLGASPGTLTAVTPTQRAAVATPEEEKAYLATFDKLKNADYNGAIAGFRNMLERWPSGRYADNAWYWMGEAQYVKRDYASALQSFLSMTQAFPDSPKMPDALLKAGRCQVVLKRSTEARGLFQRVISDYPSSNAATLARQDLQQLGG